MIWVKRLKINKRGDKINMGNFKDFKEPLQKQCKESCKKFG